MAAAPEDMNEVPAVLIRPMVEIDLPEVAQVEEASYAFPWSENIFRDCLRVGYTCRALDLAGQVIGYGVMSPATTYGHVVATCEIVTGMMSMAVITGLLFARFSKPTARMLFSRVAVITPYDGVPTLMLRVANQRRSYILEAMASMVLARDVETADGHSLRRFYDLKLERARSPMFALSWLIMHRIDADSPLSGITEEALRAGDMGLAITLSGTDETFAARERVSSGGAAGLYVAAMTLNGGTAVYGGSGGI